MSGSAGRARRSDQSEQSLLNACYLIQWDAVRFFNRNWARTEPTYAPVPTGGLVQKASTVAELHIPLSRRRQQRARRVHGKVGGSAREC